LKLDTLVDDTQLDELGRRIATLEARTSAEVVVVLRRASGSYRDLAAWGGGLAGLITLTSVMYSPWEVPYDAVLPLVVGAALGCGLLIDRWPAALRRLSGSSRLEAQAKDGAASSFVRHQVWATRERTGVLVYYSHLEQRLEFIADITLQGTVPGGVFNQIQHNFHAEVASVGLSSALGRALEQLGAALEKACPKKDGDVNERPDRPVVEA
jgi:putative membrane protein